MLVLSTHLNDHQMSRKLQNVAALEIAQATITLRQITPMPEAQKLLWEKNPVVLIIQGSAVWNREHSI